LPNFILAKPKFSAEFEYLRVIDILDVQLEGEAMADLMGCPECDTALVQIQRKKSVSSAGLISVMVFLIALALMTLNVIVGLVILIVAFVIGYGSKHQVWMVCPKCNKDVVRLK
jgi:uncharacterized protein with PIN domain